MKRTPPSYHTCFVKGLYARVAIEGKICAKPLTQRQGLVGKGSQQEPNELVCLTLLEIKLEFSFVKKED